MSKTDVRQPVSAELIIEGMHCSDCAGTVQKALNATPGVAKVKVDYTSGKTAITYDPVKVPQQRLIKTVENLGYTVRIESRVPSPSLWKSKRARYTFFSGIAYFAGLALFFFSNGIPLFQLAGKVFLLSQFLLLVSIIFGGQFLVRSGWQAVRRFELNLGILMTAAIVGAIIIGEYIEAASLAFLYSLAELLESFAVQRARHSLRDLLQLTPPRARVLKKGREIEADISEIVPGDVVAVRPGERIAVDGKVSKGTSSLDQSPITGESVPVYKKQGDHVFAGTINLDGYLEVIATVNAEESTLARIVKLVEQAETRKAPSQRFVERFARIYTPVVVAIAIAISILPTLLFNADFNDWFIRALTLLVIACPCALVISTPVSVVSALTNASKSGVLIKGGEFLERLTDIKVVAFDKTGTLTEGRLQVSDIHALNGYSEEEVLHLAASLEAKSEHPIAKAITNRSGQQAVYEVARFEAKPGLGIAGDIDGNRFFAGRPEMFHETEIELPEEFDEFAAQGKTVIFLADSERILGIITLEDTIRGVSAELVENLRKNQLKAVLLTGDNEEAARSLAERLGISRYFSGLLPEEKLRLIDELEKEEGPVAMVGDGINDAPALARASIGIAMGGIGTDMALESADVVLMSDNLAQLPYLFALSRSARRIIRQNIWASILIKVSLAMGTFFGLVSLVLAVLIGDMGATLLVTGNAMRLVKK